jgi:hypothetical protein
MFTLPYHWCIDLAPPHLAKKKLAKQSKSPEKTYSDNGVSMLYDTSNLTITSFTLLASTHYSAPITFPTPGQAMARIALGVNLNYWPASGAIGLTGAQNLRAPHEAFIMNWIYANSEARQLENEMNTGAHSPNQRNTRKTKKKHGAK